MNDDPSLDYLSTMTALAGGYMFFVAALTVLPNAIVCAMLANAKQRDGLLGFLCGLLFFPWSTIYYLGVTPRQTVNSSTSLPRTP